MILQGRLYIIWQKRQGALVSICWFWMTAGLEKRDDDNSGLGDWYVNEKKLGETLGGLVKRVNDLGVKIRYLDRAGDDL